jgi:hypothetical protein
MDISFGIISENQPNLQYLFVLVFTKRFQNKSLDCSDSFHRGVLIVMGSVDFTYFDFTSI